MKLLVPALLILGLSCCALPREPGETFAYGDFRGLAIRVTPPTVQWLAAYAGAEVCSGRRGNVRRVRFHVIPADSFQVRGHWFIGFMDGDDMYLAQPYAKDVPVPLHEALHHLGYRHPLNPKDTAAIRRDFLLFNVKCRARFPDAKDLG